MIFSVYGKKLHFNFKIPNCMNNHFSAAPPCFASCKNCRTQKRVENLIFHISLIRYNSCNFAINKNIKNLRIRDHPIVIHWN